MTRPGRGPARGTGPAALSRSAVLLCLCLLLCGCAYYNGMYNTRRFARNAERSERAGRTSEAADRWRQVVLHADTLLARHPESRWADDAELLKGRALVALGAWPAASVALERVKGRAGTEDQLREAQYWLGVASAGRRDYATALANFDSALASPRRDHRDAVRLARGRTLLAMGRPAEALRDFDAVSGGAVRFDRAVAALALGRPGPAAAHADSAVGVRGVTPERWLAFVDTLGRRGGTLEADALVDRLLVAGALPAAARARLLLADGDRLAAAGLDSLALERWAATAEMAPESDEARVATARALRHALRGPGAADREGDVRARLAALAEAGGEGGREARELLRLLRAADSLAAGAVAADALAFRAAEWLRDSIPSSPLAARGFADMAERWPASPWAPKAIVAAIAAGHPAADSLQRVLHDRYADSPYTQVAAGIPGEPEAFAAMEDSLAAALEGAVATAAEGDAAAAAAAVSDDDRITAQRTGNQGRQRPTAAPPPAPVRAAPVRAPTLPRNPEP